MKAKKTVALSLGTFMILSNGMPVYAKENTSMVDFTNEYTNTVVKTIDTVSGVVQDSINALEIETPEPVEEVSYTYVQEPVYYTVVETVSEPVSMSVEQFTPVIEETAAVDKDALKEAYDAALVNYNAALAEYEAASQIIETTKEVEVEVVEETVDEDGNPVTETRTELQTVTETAYAGDVETAKANLDVAKAALDAAEAALNTPDEVPVQNSVKVEEAVNETVQNAEVQPDQCGDDLHWNVVDNVLTISGTGAMYDYKETGPWGRNVTKVVVKDGVTTIGNYAFEYCRAITEVQLPNSIISIGDYSFSHCEGITAIDLPDNIQRIGSAAFNQDAKLKTVDTKNIAYLEDIGKYAFSGCSSLQSIVIPESVKTIGESAFDHCDTLKTLSILSEKLQSIEPYTFSNCKSLVSFWVPKGVTSIGENAFSHCTNLNGVVFSTGEYESAVTSIGFSAFADCPNLQTIDLPESLTSIGTSAFAQSGLTTIEIPSNVTSVGESVVRDCKELTSANILGDITSIGFEFFRGCTKLSEVNIPTSVSKIGEKAFMDCTDLTSLTLSAAITSIDSTAFTGCNNLTLKVYEGSYAQQFAKDHNIPSDIIDKVVIESKQELILDGSIGVDFLYKFEPHVLNDDGARVEFTVAGKTTSYSIKNARTKGDYRIISIYVASGQMTDNIETKIILSSGDSISSDSSSVKKCCDAILADPTASESKKSLVKALLVYGGYSQVYFNYNPTELAYEGQDITVSDVTPTETKRYESKKDGSVEGLKYVGSTLSFESLTTIKHYFKVEEGHDIKDFTFTMGGKTLEPVANGNLYYVKIEDIPSNQLDTVYSVSVGGFNIQYSALSYVYAQLKKESSNESLNNACRAFYKYNEAAKAYLV